MSFYSIHRIGFGGVDVVWHRMGRSIIWLDVQRHCLKSMIYDI